MINVIQNGEIYEITFQYDPNVIALIKNVPGRTWNATGKMWTIPKDRLGFLINEFRGTQYEPFVKIHSDEEINQNEELGSTTVIPDIDISKIPFHVKGGSTPYKHQLDFMKWAIDRQNHGNMHGFICADSMGLGKSVESANLAFYNKKQYNFKHCLVICCVNSTKYHWQDDIKVHLNEPAYILGTRLRRDGTEKCDTGSLEKLEDLNSTHMYNNEDSPELPYFIIVNIEALRYRSGKKHPITDKIIELILNQTISMIIIDEVHKNLSPSSDQGKQILQIKKATGGAAMWIPMTGTPITKQPMDVYTPLLLCNGHDFTSYYKWCQNFCVYGGFGGYEVVGYKNIPYLKNLLENNMIRRLKSDVLDLPPKITYTEYVENTEYQHKLYKQVLGEIIAQESEILTSLNPMARFLRLRQVNGSPELIDNNLKVDNTYIKKNAKLQRLLELIDEIVERGEKVVVFSNWVEPLRTLYKFISTKYKTCVFTGTMSVEDREKHKRVFQSNSEYKVLLGTIGAAGTGQTFTAARNVIFYDSPWNPSDKEQASDRIYRIGTTQSVNIFTLVSKDTVDDRVEQILSNKDGVAKYIVDGKLDLRNNPRLFDFLLGGD